MADHTNYFQHPAGIDVEDESALAAAERAEVAADSAEASATAAAASATESNSWKDLSKAWAIQLVTQVDEGAGPVDYSSKHYATVVAAGHASDAGNSAAAAAATLVAFEQAYLGTKAGDPAVDNEGLALIEGAVYWNSTNKILRLYNGTSWQDWDPVQLVISDWAAATNYTIGNAVIGTDGVLYVAAETHISDGTDFNTDLNAGKWRDVHPAGTGGFQTVTQFSPDGNVWYDQYQTGWTWARTREVTLAETTWPTSLAEIPSPQQGPAWDGYTGSDTSTVVTDDARKATTIGTGAVNTYPAQYVHPDRKTYFEFTFGAGTVNGSPSNNPWVGIFPSSTLGTTLISLMHDTSNWYVYNGGIASNPSSDGVLEYTLAQAPVNGDKVMFAINASGQRAWVGLNGTWLGTGTQDPSLDLGGYIISDLALTGYGPVYLAGTAATNSSFEGQADLAYLPPVGFAPYGNPTLSGYLDVVSDDERWADVAFLMTFDGLKEQTDPDDLSSHYLYSADVNKLVPWPWVERANERLNPQYGDLQAPSGADPFSLAEATFGYYYPGSEIRFEQGEDWTIEYVIHTSLYNGNREYNILQMAPTGQKNSVGAASYATLHTTVDSGAPAASTGVIYRKSDPGVSTVPQTKLYAQGLGYFDAEQWHHVILEKEAGTVYAVVDGVQIGSIDNVTDPKIDDVVGFLGPTSGYANANKGSNSLVMLNSLYAFGGSAGLHGMCDQIRVTRRGARYGLNNWPTSLPQAKWPGAIVPAIDEDGWKVYRIGTSVSSVDGEIAVEFSNGNGTWHSGYEAGDSLGRIVETVAGDSSYASTKLSWDVSVDTTLQVDADGDLAILATGVDYRNGYSNNTFYSGDKVYFEMEFAFLENQGTEVIGMIGADRKVRDASPDVSVYGGFTLQRNGTVTGNPGGLYGNSGFSTGTNIGIAADVGSKKYWVRINGVWQNESLDYDDACNMDVDFDAVGTGLTIFAANYQGIPTFKTAGDKWVYMPETPRYTPPPGFLVVGKTTAAGGSETTKRVLGTFPVGAADTGTQIEFSADGLTWNENYTEGDSYARIPRQSAGIDDNYTYWSAKDSPWNGGITDGSRSSAGGFLFTDDGEHASGKHYWEVTFEGVDAYPGSPGTSIIPAPYWDGQVAWEGDTFGACIGLAGPQIAGVSDPNRVKSGGRYYSFDTSPYTIESRDTYFFMNKKDRYARNGSLVAGYGMQYEGPDRIGTTDYTGMKWNETWGLAVDVDNGLYWVIDSTGTVIPSGDPAAGTGGFSIPTGQAYRFLVDFRAAAASDGLVRLRGTSVHGTPSGFTFHGTNPGVADPIIAADSQLYMSFENGKDDESPNAFTNTLNGSAAVTAGAALGNGAQGLDNGTGSGQLVNYLKSPTSANLDIPLNGKFVIKLKCKGVGTAGGTWQWIASTDPGANPQTAGIGILTNESSGVVYVYFNGATILNGIGEGAFTDEREILVERNATGTIRVYINGVYKGGATGQTAALTVGAWHLGSATNQPATYSDFNGYIDDFFFSPDATTACPFGGDDTTGYTVDPEPLGTNSVPESSFYKEWRMGGAVHHFGSAAPATTLGKVGDIFTDTTGKTVYEKTAATTWTSRYTYT